MKKLVEVVSVVVVALGLFTVVAGNQAAVVNAQNVKPGLSQVAPTDPSIKKGDNIFVIVKDTKKQTVPVYNKNAKKTHNSVKMGSEFTAKQVKRVHGKKIVRVASNKWLNVKDVAQD